MQLKYSLSGSLWQYTGAGAWYFITLPAELNAELAAMRNPMVKGFGALRVVATIGWATWKTALFPDTKAGAYMLPVKKEIRMKNGLEVGQEVAYEIEILSEYL